MFKTMLSTGGNPIKEILSSKDELVLKTETVHYLKIGRV
jgi:hypothetical protein